MFSRDYTLYRLSKELGVEDLNDLEAALSRLSYRELASVERTGDGFAKPLPEYSDTYLLYVGHSEHEWVRRFELGDTLGVMPNFHPGEFRFKGFSAHPADALVMLFYREEKVVVSADIRRRVQAKVKELEADGMRKVYAKERAQLRDEIVARVLPHAQSNLWRAPVVFLSSGYVLIGAVGRKAEIVATAVRDVLGTFPIRPVNTKFEVVKVLTGIAKLQAKGEFDRFVLTDDFQMQGIEEHPPIARMKNTDITDENVQGLLDHKVISHAAVCWDQKIHFKTEPRGTIRKVKVDDAVLEEMDQDNEDVEGMARANYATLMIEHNMLNQMLNEWLILLGGEEEVQLDKAEDQEPVILSGLAERGVKASTPEAEEEE